MTDSVGLGDYITISYSTTSTIKLQLFYEDKDIPFIKPVYNLIPIPVSKNYKNKRQKLPKRFNGYWFKLGKKK